MASEKDNETGLVIGSGYCRAGEGIALGACVMAALSPGRQSPVEDASSLLEAREAGLAPGISYKIMPPTDDSGGVAATTGESAVSFSPRPGGCGAWQLQSAEGGAGN